MIALDVWVAVCHIQIGEVWDTTVACLTGILTGGLELPGQMSSSACHIKAWHREGKDWSALSPVIGIGTVPTSQSPRRE